jgi:hypothetical protein
MRRKKWIPMRSKTEVLLRFLKSIYTELFKSLHIGKPSFWRGDKGKPTTVGDGFEVINLQRGNIGGQRSFELYRYKIAVEAANNIRCSPYRYLLDFNKPTIRQGFKESQNSIFKSCLGLHYKNPNPFFKKDQPYDNES